jgi:hypothetical protein
MRAAKLIQWASLAAFLVLTTGCDGWIFRSKLAPGDRVSVDPAFLVGERATIDKAFRMWNEATDGCAYYVFGGGGYQVIRRDYSPTTYGHTSYFPTGKIYLDPDRVGTSGLRTVIHEIGHAGGLDDVRDDPESIMYYQNNGKTKIDPKSVRLFKEQWGCR